MVSLSDLTNGPKMFKETFGPKWGPRWWKVVFTIAVLAIVTACLVEIGGGGKAAYTEIKAWLYPPTTSSRPSVPLQPQGCAITGGENHGSIVQNCK
jgi:hypothetical protein